MVGDTFSARFNGVRTCDSCIPPGLSTAEIQTLLSNFQRELVSSHQQDKSVHSYCGPPRRDTLDMSHGGHNRGTARVVN